MTMLKTSAKLLSIVLSLVLVTTYIAALSHLAAWAYSGEYLKESDYFYRIDNEKITILRYVGNDAQVIIPTKIAGYDVVSIGANSKQESYMHYETDPYGGVAVLYDGVFTDYSTITSVTIPAGIASIGYNAFGNCKNLISITIPDSVTEISEMAFTGCTDLNAIHIPRGVTNIGAFAFDGLANCISFIVDEQNSNYSSKDGVLYNKEQTSLLKIVVTKGLTDFVILDSVSTVEDCAFDDCKELTSISIPSNVKNIGKAAFNSCVELKTVNLPEGLTSIKSHTFLNCGNLKSINIPETVEYIESGAFSGCVNLVSIKIPKNTSVEPYAFYGCKELTISCYKNSDAHELAQNFDIDYILLDIEEKLGDVDLDGKVTIKDATLIQKYLAKMVKLTKQKNRFADFNHDGKVNIKDATAIQKFIAKIV